MKLQIILNKMITTKLQIIHIKYSGITNCSEYKKPFLSDVSLI